MYCYDSSSVFSVHLCPTSLHIHFSLIREWDRESKSFDVATSPAQTIPSYPALSWAYRKH